MILSRCQPDAYGSCNTTRVPAHAQNDNLSVEVSFFKHIFGRDESLHLFIIARTLAFAPEPDLTTTGVAQCQKRVKQFDYAISCIHPDYFINWSTLL
jgi:hypothetical protein